MDQKQLLEFEIKDGILVKYKGEGGCVELPAEVSEIAEGAFEGACVTHLILHSDVEGGLRALASAEDLTEVTLGEGVTKIGRFYRMPPTVKRLTVSDTVGEISEESVLSWRGLAEIHIPSVEAWCRVRVNRMGGFFGSGLCQYANLYLDGAPLEHLVIPEGVESFDGHAFHKCQSLRSVTVAGSVAAIPDDAFRCCRGLRTVILGEGVTRIGKSAFAGCESLEQIDLPASLASIGDWAFSGCKGLRRVSVPDLATWLRLRIEDESLMRNESSPLHFAPELSVGGEVLRELAIPEGVEEIPEGAFAGYRGLTSLVIPRGVKTVGKAAFSDCKNLGRVTLAEGLETLGYGAFSGCASLGEVTLPESVRSVGGAAFARCASLAAVTLPEGLETIEYSTFRDCAALTALSIPQGVKKIGSRAFEKCVSLRSAVIPRSVERLEEGAFSGCTALSDVAVLGRPQVEKGVFSGCPIATFDTVPAEAIPPETVAALLGKPFGEVPASLKRCYRPADAALEGAVEVEGLGFFALLPCGEEEWPFVVSACGEWIKVKETEYGLDTSMTELGFGGVTEETAKIDPLPWECLIAEGEVFGLYWEGRPYLFAEAGRVYEVDESTDGVREDTVEVDITRTYIQKR